jgi:hypothetical protein
MSETESMYLNLFNLIFTWIFISEMLLKLIGLGPVTYLKDRINHLDTVVVALSIAELVATQS